MKLEELRDSVEGIHMKEKMRQEVTAYVQAGTEKSREAQEGAGKHEERPESPQGRAGKYRKDEYGSGKADRKKAFWMKIAAAAVLLLFSGIVAFPVRAFVNSLVQERLEGMSLEEVDAVLETAVGSREEADSFSREYTDSERARYHELAEKYQAGTFPESEIPQVDKEEKAKPDELCFIVPRSMFYLPDRELTDEEILEIIDFRVKRDFAFRQNYENEYAQEIQQQEEKEKQQIAENIESGGITEQQAVEAATDTLETFFGTRGEGMELNCFYSETGWDGNGEGYYSVTWTDIVTHKCYYVNIDARDGRVLWAAQTDPDSVDVPDLVVEEAKEKINILREYAEAFMKEKAGINYENVYVYYLECKDGRICHDGVRFVFETSDQKAYGVTYSWDGMLEVYTEVDLADYEERNGKMRTLHRRGEETEMRQVFQKIGQGFDMN